MTIFSSGKHESLTTDSLPWVWIGRKSGAFSGRCSVTVPEHAAHAYRGEFTPRPELATPLTNPVNPLMIAARAAVEAGASYADLRDDLLGFPLEYPGVEAFDKAWLANQADPITDDHNEHLLAVLNLLVTLTEADKEASTP